jgi:hypothetical protein
MTKEVNKGSKNQNAPQAARLTEPVSGDNSKGNKHNRTQK